MISKRISQNSARLPLCGEMRAESAVDKCVHFSSGAGVLFLENPVNLLKGVHPAHGSRGFAREEQQQTFSIFFLFGNFPPLCPSVIASKVKQEHIRVFDVLVFLCFSCSQEFCVLAQVCFVALIEEMRWCTFHFDFWRLLEDFLFGVLEKALPATAGSFAWPFL